jgi:cell division protease FtsH
MALGDPQEEKKNIGGGLGLFLLAVLVAVMYMQSFFEAKLAKISFSYQVEHLVNLDLIKPEESKKTATASNLVNFSGKFQENLSDTARHRFHYLELTKQLQDLKKQQSEMRAERDFLKTQALEAIQLYSQVWQLEIPASGLMIYVAPGSRLNEGSALVFEPKAVASPVASLQQMQEKWHKRKVAVNAYVSELIDWTGWVASPELGIADDQMKQALRLCLRDLEALGDSQEIAKVAPVVENVFSRCQAVLSALDNSEGDWRFGQLRSIRELKEIVKKLAVNEERIEQTASQQAKERPFVATTVWFVNNKELSSSALEKQEPEEFARWFERAKTEWERFEFNKTHLFKASDQPNYLVLERTFRSEEAPPNYFGLLFSLMPVILVAFLIYFMFARQVKGVGGSAMTFGKSPAKLLQKGNHKITFKDVAGIDEAREELQEIVDFLKDPARFTRLGAEIPKGVLCVGPPGTGKTLIAKAVAGEADRPFFSISGSDFVEMFVGVGASRIRDMFKDAKKHAPCIIFMDEIDAVGRHRGVGIGGGHDEREQTLNQLLVEMDGFEANEGIILMAATNRPDVLDKALLRPGRFDRRVTIDLPDIKGRFEILKLHAKKIKMAEDVDLMQIARGTPGSSGADLKNILNEAALRAVRMGHEFVTQEDVSHANDKVRFGKERRSLEMTKEEISRTAYHEAGHAIVALASKHCDPVEKVTVIPRGMALGATYTLPRGNRVGYWKQELCEIMAMIMGGRAAEEIFIGDISSGAQSDINRVTHMARSMVCEWGMSERLGQIAYEERSEANMYLGGGQSVAKPYSDQTAQVIDDEVKKLIKEAHQRATDLMHQYKDQVELMAQMLIRFETLDAEDVQAIMEHRFDPETKEKKIRADLGSEKKAEESSDRETVEAHPS